MDFLENSPLVLCKLIAEHQKCGSKFVDFEGASYDPFTVSLLAIEHFSSANDKDMLVRTLHELLPHYPHFDPNAPLAGSSLCAFAVLAKALPNYAITTFGADEVAEKVLLEWQKKTPFNGSRNNNPAYLLARNGNYGIVNQLLSTGLASDTALLTKCVLSSIPTKLATAGLGEQFGNDFIQYSMGELSKMCIDQHIDPSMPINGRSLFDIILEEGHTALHQSLLGEVLNRKIELKAAEMNDVLTSIQQSQPELATRLRVSRHF